MRNSLLSQIKILHSDQIYTYEWYEPKLIPDDMNVNEMTLIKHPFMVTRLSEDNYLLLGQTGLYSTMLAAGLKHFPVQVCRDEDLRLLPQKLGLINFTAEDLRHYALEFPRQVIICDKETTYLAGYIPVCFSFRNRAPLWVYFRQPSRSGCPLPLETVFRAVLNRGCYVPFLDSLHGTNSILKTRYLDNTVVLPAFSLEDLKNAAVSERLFPPDVVKVFSCSRVVNVDFPLSVLDSEIPIEEKESFLRELIAYREQANRTVFLEGTVYILNI
ncbi:MAG: hypothetical protein JXA92_07715 [candidate division Zixibacteria bacterium]|nr:hypothetical protein [candidate division Zixibacteria bacterium]